LGLARLSFAGADVGGFFYDPSPILLTRWYQLGAFYPFFRAHAHHQTKRREPWLFGEPYTTLIRSAIRTRYSLLPFWYTLFFKHTQTGAPLLRPLWVDFPADATTFSLDDSFLVGSEFLVQPVVAGDQTTANVYLPGTDSVWFDYQNLKAHAGNRTIAVETPLHKIPVFLKGGSIIPKKERQRRSSVWMVDDPVSLFVALDKKGNAAGELYVDDGHSFNFRAGEYDLVAYKFAGSILFSSPQHIGLSSCAKVESVTVVGGPKPDKVTLISNHINLRTDLDFKYFEDDKKIVVQVPPEATGNPECV